MANRLGDPLPVPPHIHDSTDAALHERELTSDQRHSVRRLVEWAYAEGYAAGHTAGGREVFRDHRVDP